MTKPREKTREELQAEIEDEKKKIRQFENREKMLRQKLSNQRVVIYYNCIGAFDVPDRRKIPETDIIMETRKGAALSYAPEQVAAIMFRYATYGGADNAADADISTYSDFGSMSEYAADGIRYVIATGIMTGKTDTTFNPLDNMTRAETAAVIARMLSK